MQKTRIKHHASKAVTWILRFALLLVIAFCLTVIGKMAGISGITLRSLELFGEIMADRLFPEFSLFHE